VQKYYLVKLPVFNLVILLGSQAGDSAVRAIHNAAARTREASMNRSSHYLYWAVSIRNRLHRESELCTVWVVVNGNNDLERDRHTGSHGFGQVAIERAHSTRERAHSTGRDTSLPDAAGFFVTAETQERLNVSRKLRPMIAPCQVNAQAADRASSAL